MSDPQPATIDMVAQRAGVSISTVSRVLNRSVPVAEPTAARVLAAVAELGYVPQMAAKSLARGRTRALGLLLPDINNDFFWPLLRSITVSAGRAGYTVVVSVRDSPDAPPQVGRHNADGLIIFNTSATPAELRSIRATGIPMVLLYQNGGPDLSIPLITIENKRGAYLVVSHLIEAHGHSRIAMLTGPQGSEDSYWREQGYYAALAEHRIAADPALVGPGMFDEASSCATVAAWLEAGLEFSAVFACDDDSARGALRALAQAGRRVPEDVAVVGFDDSPLSPYTQPPLTTVHAPTEQVGQRAVAQLIHGIEHGQMLPLTLLPTELILRRSCGCGAAGGMQ